MPVLSFVKPHGVAQIRQYACAEKPIIIFISEIMLHFTQTVTILNINSSYITRIMYLLLHFHNWLGRYTR